MESSAPQVVYDSLQKAQQAAPHLKPIPAFDVYKVAREEELAAYRMLCRVLHMHHGAQLPKAQQRLLEDMAEELHITAERQALEREMAQEDLILQGIRQSGVLLRRGDFTDGVVDATIEAYLAEAPRDDQNCLYAPATKAARVEGADGAAGRAGATTAGAVGGAIAGAAATAGATGVAAVVGAKKKGHVHAAVSKLAKEIEAAGKALLYANNSQEEQQLIQSLQHKRNALVALKEEFLEA